MAVSLLQAHTLVSDPHADRAYADERFVPLVGDVVSKSRTVDKDEDEPRTSVTLVDDASLSLPVTGTGRYALEAFLVVDGDSAAGMSLTFTAPEGATGSWTPMAPEGSGGTGDVRTAAVDYGVAATVGVSAEGVIVPPRGTLITGSTSGVLTLRWAPTTTPATPLTLRAGSWLRLTRMG